MKGVRYGDTGLSAAGNCFRKKACRERTTRVRGRTGLFRRPSVTSSGVGVAGHADGSGCGDDGAAVPRGHAARCFSTACSAPSDSHLPPIFCRSTSAGLGSAWCSLRGHTGCMGRFRHRSGLHEQRMTVQATLTSGLLLCGTLYLSSGEAISRVVVALMVVFTTALLCLRRAMWRRDGVPAVPGGDRDAQCADRGCGAGGACAAESY